MTPIGHTLTGLAIGVGFLPANISWRSKIAMLATYCFMANLPDLPIPFWGHSRYDISHSVFVTLIGIAIVVVFARVASKSSLSWAFLSGASLAWLSHLLLDTFYCRGIGLGMFWPLNHARVALPIPCFETMVMAPLFGAHNRQVFLVEFAFYGTVLSAVATAKYAVANRSADARFHPNGASK